MIYQNSISNNGLLKYIGIDGYINFKWYLYVNRQNTFNICNIRKIVDYKLDDQISKYQSVYKYPTHIQKIIILIGLLMSVIVGYLLDRI
jgi:hypothetical protein